MHAYGNADLDALTKAGVRISISAMRGDKHAVLVHLRRAVRALDLVELSTKTCTRYGNLNAETYGPHQEPCLYLTDFHERRVVREGCYLAEQASYGHAYWELVMTVQRLMRHAGLDHLHA